MGVIPDLLDDFEVRFRARDAWRRQLAADAMLEARLAAGAAGPRPQLVVPVPPGRKLPEPVTGDLFGTLPTPFPAKRG